MRQSSAPWYRDRWPWLLILGPAIVAVACMITIWLAYAHPDHVIISKEAVRGLVVNIDHAPPKHGDIPQRR